LLTRLRNAGNVVFPLRFGPLGWIRVSLLIRRIRPDIVHLHLIKSLAYSFPSILLNKKRHYVYTVHNQVLYPGMKLWKRTLFPLFMKSAAARMARIIAVSGDICTYLKDDLRISSERIIKIDNGVKLPEPQQPSPSKEELRRRLGLPQDAWIIGTVGRLSSEKGQDILIDAFSRITQHYPSAICVIVGEGPLKKGLLQMAKYYGLMNKILLPGFQQNPFAWLSAMDVVVFPSRSEGFPLTVIEAASIGRPIIAAAVGGIRDIVLNNNTGFLVPPENSQALYMAITKSITNYDRAKELGERARALALEKFGIDKCRSEVIQIYRTLIAQPL